MNSYNNSFARFGFYAHAHAHAFILHYFMQWTQTYGVFAGELMPMLVLCSYKNDLRRLALSDFNAHAARIWTET